MSTASPPPEPHHNPLITVVIPVRNGARHVERALRGVAAQDFAPDRRETLVVDNGSTDGSGDLARSLGARVIPCPVPGVARARQTGWQAARGELVAYLDVDCEPAPDWLSRAAAQLSESPRLGALGVRLLDAEPTNLVERHIIASHFLDTDHFWRPSPDKPPFLVTAGMVVRRAALEEVGGFDLTFGRATGEDADLCYRLADAGWEVRYDRAITVIHHHRSTLRAMLRQAHWYGWGVAEVQARHGARMPGVPRVDSAPYRRLRWCLKDAVPNLLWKHRGDRYERVRPLLEGLDAVAFLLGKYRGALRNGRFRL